MERNLMSFARIFWEDAAWYEDEWLSRNDLSDNGFMIDTCGIVVKENERMIWVARDFDPDTDKFRHIIAIPKTLIVDMTIA